MAGFAVVVTPRDRFSTTGECLERIFRYTPGADEVVLSAGGVSAALRASLEARFGGRVRFLCFPEYRNTAELRNAALREVRAPLAVCLDTDVYVREGWLAAMLRCREETGASMVVPLVLDRDDLVHTAGNDLFVTEKEGRRSCQMEIRYAHAAVGEKTNLTRRPTDFGEIHCQLVDVRDALDLGIYDEAYREGSDIDSGLTLAKAGKAMMFEPEARVYLTYPDRLDDLEDVKLYIWKWDMDATRASFEHFERKWGMSRTGRDGASIEYYKMVNNRIGYLTRVWPNAAVLRLDNAYSRAKRALRGGPARLWRGFKDASLGY